ncbi:MAG: hypothetical protein HYT68_00290 [Candidatus Zambryskibacteria bacterium]|nr:hypothetical protein [Candidatus Zambryskibacteria bacterium]
MKKSMWLLVLVLLVAGVIWLIGIPAKPGKLDAFAQCINDSGAKYYAAFWCPNCKNQEAMFGRSAGLLPRIECSTPDGRGQLLVCREANIQGYPTWEFTDGTRESGTQSLEVLSERTNCPLPADQ